ncbi:MAG: radical SAM protein [Rhodospirillales bacterium]|nr:radical SAM protein [Rhodospirillales bacterium]
MEVFQSKIHLSHKNISSEFKAAKIRFSAYLCLAYDNGEDDLVVLEAVGNHLKAFDGGLALYGTGHFLEYLLQHVPNLVQHVDCFVSEDDNIPEQLAGVKTAAPSELPSDISTVFICETRTFYRWRMECRLPEGVTVKSLNDLPDIAWNKVPSRSWIPDIFSIYPIDVPEISFEKGKDLILMDVPARNLALMPNGLAYVHNALKSSSVSYQTLDTDIIIYHRFHIHRIFDLGGHVVLPSGKELPVDPWQAENYELWADPKVVDYFRPDLEEIITGLVGAHPKVIGMSIQECNEAFSREIVNAVKAVHPDIIIVVGGFSCYNPDVGRKAFPECDYMCVGEADLTVNPLMESLARGEIVKHMPGVLSHCDDDDYAFVPGPMPHDLDDIEFPKYEWFDIDVYRNFNNYQLTPILASRGCRWSRCTFCAERFYWRIRSPKAFVDEIEWLMDRGCNLFMFNESDLNGMPERLLDICNEIVRRQLPTKLAGQLRIHKKSDRAFFDKLKQAGFVALRFGIDALSENTLKLQKKGYTVETISQNLKDCAEAGIYSEVNWVIGVPGETDEDIEEGIDLIIDNKDHIGRLANINRLVLANGSVYWIDPDSHNIKFRGDPAEIYANNARAIPEDLWYSEEPYIDGKVRRSRFARVVERLRDAGFDVGPWASKVIELTLGDSDGVDDEARGDSDMPMPPEWGDAESLHKGTQEGTFQANSAVPVPRPPVIDTELALIRFEDKVYGLREDQVRERFDQVPPDELQIIWAEDEDGAPEFIASYGDFNLISYKDKYYASPHGLLVSWPKVESGVYPEIMVRSRFNEIREDVINKMRERGVDLRKHLTALGVSTDLLVSVVHTARMGIKPLHIWALFDYGLIQMRQGNFRKLLTFYFMIAGKALKPVIRRILGPIRG